MHLHSMSGKAEHLDYQFGTLAVGDLDMDYVKDIEKESQLFYMNGMNNSSPGLVGLPGTLSESMIPKRVSRLEGKRGGKTARPPNLSGAIWHCPALA